MALGQQGDNGRTCIPGGGGKEHWDPHRKQGAGRMGLRAKVVTQEARSERPKLGMWHCQDKSQGQRHWQTNDSIQAKKMLYLPLGYFLDRPAKYRRQLG